MTKVNRMDAVSLVEVGTKHKGSYTLGKCSSVNYNVNPKTFWWRNRVLYYCPGWL